MYIDRQFIREKYSRVIKEIIFKDIFILIYNIFYYIYIYIYTFYLFILLNSFEKEKNLQFFYISSVVYLFVVLDKNIVITLLLT